MPRNYIDIGSTPCEEPCDGVGAEASVQKAECKRFINVIRQKLGLEPGTARLAIKANSHDFGTYYEVVCYFDDADPIGENYAFFCESNSPATWTDVEPVAVPDHDLAACE